MRNIFNTVCFLKPLEIVIPLLGVVALLTCSAHDRDNPIDPQGTNWNPPTVSVMQDTSVAITIDNSGTKWAAIGGSLVKF